MNTNLLKASKSGCHKQQHKTIDLILFSTNEYIIKNIDNVCVQSMAMMKTLLVKSIHWKKQGLLKGWRVKGQQQMEPPLGRCPWCLFVDNGPIVGYLKPFSREFTINSTPKWHYDYH